MAITRLSQSSVQEGLEKYTTALGNYVPSLGVLDSIQTVTVGAGGTSSITFSGISSRFQHLHLRYLLPSSVTDNNFIIRFNGDPNANYTLHELSGNGASAGAGAVTALGFIRVGYWQTGTLSQPYYGIVDILDVSSTSKNTTVRTFSGVDTNGGDGFVRLTSGLWNNTAAVTSVTFSTVQSNVPQNSVVHLYGVVAR